ncbi:Mitogen-activated protein kinase kinase kinase 12, partial [Stegodyphus mimosarum]
MQNFQDKESRVPLVEEDLVKQRREELRHAQDIREHYERKLERANNLYMELATCLLQLEQRERELVQREENLQECSKQGDEKVYRKHIVRPLLRAHERLTKKRALKATQSQKSPDDGGLNSEVPQAKKAPPQIYVADPTAGHFPSQSAVYVAEVPPKQEFEVFCDEHSPNSYAHQKNSSSTRNNSSLRPAVVFNMKQNIKNQDADVPTNFRSRPSNVEVIKNRLSGNPRHSNWDLFDSDETYPPAKIPNWQIGSQSYDIKQVNREQIFTRLPEGVFFHSEDASNGNGPVTSQKETAVDAYVPFTYCVGGSLESLKQPKRPQNFS